MSNPLYFVTNCKESVSVSWGCPISMGCGVTRSGDLRLPNNFWCGTPLLFDDAFPVLPKENCLKSLRSLCENGCILDFERNPDSFHLQIMHKMMQWGVVPLWIPAKFASISVKAIIIFKSDLPHNNWRQYCQSIQDHYPNRWALEFQPILWSRKLTTTNNSPKTIFLQDSVSMCKIFEDMATYYDTLETLQKKMQIAMECGCQGGIALWQEWENKTMTQPK